MTLSFLLHATEEEESEHTQRTERFRRETDEILSDCGMYQMSMDVPYERFLLQCMNTIDPLCTFNDVLEMCYWK